MGKSYLNSSDKEKLFLYASMTTVYDEYIESANKAKNKDKFSIKIWKLLRTYTFKLMDNMMIDLSGEQKENIIRQLGNYHICVDYKSNIKMLMQQKEKLDSEIVMSMSDINDIIDLALASCSVCDSCGEDVVNCKYRRVFIKYDVDAVNTGCKEGGCPYRF